MPATHDDPAFVAALRSALAADGTAYASRPSQLRARLNRILGEDTTTHRREVHLVVTALDENVPSELRAGAPLSRADLDRHAEALAAARGWTQEAGATAVRLWVTALDLDLTSAGHWPDPRAQRPGSPSGGSKSGETSTPGSLEPGPSWPDDGPPRSFEDSATAGARGHESASTVLPARRDDPMATDLPDASSVVASVLPVGPASPTGLPAGWSAPSGAGPSGTNPAGPPDGGPAPWPPSSRFAIAQAVQREGFPVGAYYAFRGRNPRLRIVAMAVFTLVVSGLVFVASAALRTPLLLVAVLAVLVVPTKVVRNGTLVVDDHGFRWYAALPKNGPAELTVPWSQAGVVEGGQPRLTFPDGELWLKPRKGLLEAIRTRVPSAPSVDGGRP